VLDEALGTEAMLLGRRTYEGLAAKWPSRTGALADRLNSKPKYVVSSTLRDPAWNNTTVLRGDVANEVAKLKHQVAGDIVLAGSFQLLRTLLEHQLVDELRLMIYPVVLGAGARLFGETSDKKAMRLVDANTVGNDLVCLRYEPISPA
jgi:dihydrofolate reductase